MNRRTDNERLLDEVLADESGAGFDAALLDETLRHVRRRKQWRRARSIGALALVVGIGIAVWHRPTPRVTWPEIASLPDAHYQLVVSQPLLPSQVVTTSPGTAQPVLVSAVPLELIHTSAGGYHEVGDDELIALAAPQIVALVRRGPHEAELVFLPPPAEAAPQQN